MAMAEYLAGENLILLRSGIDYRLCTAEEWLDMALSEDRTAQGCRRLLGDPAGARSVRLADLYLRAACLAEVVR